MGRCRSALDANTAPALLSSKRFPDISHFDEIHCGQELGDSQLFSELITFVNVGLNLVKIY